MKQKVNIANMFTSMRILGAIFLLFIEPFNTAFYVIYTVSGVTDALDGFIARQTNTASELGAKLDSIADLCFYIVMLVRILPKLIEILPRIIWWFVAFAVLVRIAAYVVAAIKYRKFASLHTWLNKTTSAMIFAVPYVIPTVLAVPYCWICCIIGGIASIEELSLHILVKKYSTSVKSVFNLL